MLRSMRYVHIQVSLQECRTKQHYVDNKCFGNVAAFGCLGTTLKLLNYI